MSRIFVNDNDDLIVVAQTSTGEYIGQAFRIVASGIQPTLELVPLGTDPVRLTKSSVDSIKPLPLVSRDFVNRCNNPSDLLDLVESGRHFTVEPA